MVELYFNAQSDNGSLTDDHALRQWSQSYRQALDDIKDIRAPTQLHNMMASAGLVEIDMQTIPLPLSGWPSGRCHPAHLGGRPSHSGAFQDDCV